MDSLRRFLAILIADARERSRATRFWVVLGIVAVITWWCFPPLDAGYMTVSINAGVRAHYSSAWVGMALALMYSTLMSLVGFYLVRGTIVRDFETRVWQLLVATPMTRSGYLLAKWASHMLVFALIMALGLMIGLVAQWLRAEDRHVDLIELIKPVIWLSLPALTFTAMFAVLFDLLPWLRRTGGNVLYFFVWIALFAMTVSVIDPEKSQWARETWLSDPNGIALAVRDLRAHLAAVLPAVEFNGMSIGSSPYVGKAILFEWLQWSPRGMDLVGRLLWPLLAVVLVIAMSPMLDWAASQTNASSTRTRSGSGRRLRWLDRALVALEGRPLGMLWAAELKLILRARRGWWWLALIVVGLVQLFGSVAALGTACIVAWLISTDVFARSILREHEAGTSALVFTAANSTRRILIVRMLTALALSIVPVLPALLRLSIQDAQMGLAVILAACSIAISGLAIGVLCRNPRPFELLLVILAYIGVQGQATLNASVQPGSMIAQHAVVLPISFVLLVLLWHRQRQYP